MLSTQTKADEMFTTQTKTTEGDLLYVTSMNTTAFEEPKKFKIPKLTEPTDGEEEKTKEEQMALRVRDESEKIRDEEYNKTL